VRSPQRARRAAGDSMRRAADHGSPPALHASAHHAPRRSLRRAALHGSPSPSTRRGDDVANAASQELLSRASVEPPTRPRLARSAVVGTCMPTRATTVDSAGARTGSNLQPVGGDGADVPGCCESICTTSACPVAVAIVPASTPSSVHAHLRCCATREVTTATFRLHVIIQRGCSLGCSRRLPG
jgi:hypothetical protein